MKSLVFLYLLIQPLFAEANCPSLCVCKSSRQNEATTPDSSEWIKLKCGGPENPISELKEIDLSKVSDVILNLNLSGNVISTLSRELHLLSLQKLWILSGNVISTLSRELHLLSLQKLDLSKNQISLIETDAFYNLSNLQRLDLSGNLIKTIYKEIFKGLLNLERLVLAQNLIQTLAASTFEYLSGLKQLDLSGNPLKCECDLVWLGDWSRDSNVKLLGNPKCGSPESVAGQAVRKIKLFLDLATCSSVLGVPLNVLMLRPYNTQIVFEGDTLTLKCRAPFTPVNSVYELKWIHPETLLNASQLEITNLNVMDEGLAESVVTVSHIVSNHTGNWSCRYTRDNETHVTQHLEVVVITPLTQYCPADVTVDNRGKLYWPQALQGRVVQKACGEAVAVRLCNADGVWEHLNTSACPYASETTKMLQQFALLNITTSKGTALAAAHRLSSLVESNVPPAGTLQDADDVHFVSRAVNNYLQYAHQEKDLGWALLDILSLMLHLPHSVMLHAEQQYEACTALVLAAEEISKYTGSVQSHKMNIALERFSVRRTSFTGVTCVWYEEAGAGVRSVVEDVGAGRQLHCTTTNSTLKPLLSVRQNIISSIQIPSTLLYRVDNSIDSPETAIHKAYSLVVAMYSSAALFPVLPLHEGSSSAHRPKDYYGYSTKRDDMNMEITSPVVGLKLVNVTLRQHLAEPVYVMVRDMGVSSGVEGRAVMWDEHKRKWNDATDSSCSVSHIVADMVVIRCYQLGYVALLQSVERGYYGQRVTGARFKVSHPAVYVGALVLLLCLATNVLTYTLCFSAIQMSKRSKHALINTWISMAALCFLYTLGIYQTEDLKLCQILGLLIHYLSLSSLLWMVVSASDVYKCVSKNNNLNIQSPEDDVNPEIPVQKPILGLYLVGWGIALIVCGISGAVNLKDYASYSQCFLSTIPSLSALFVPAGILVIFLTVMYLLIRCTIRDMNGQLSEGTQATENVDSEMWEPSMLVNNDEAERATIRSGVISEREDLEHAPMVQLRALVIVLTLYMSVWTCGAVTVYRPFPSYLPYQEDIFSILYALCGTFLGTFILFFYGIARSDVREQWLTMQCYLGKNKRCCRNRSVFDTDLQQNHSNQNGLIRTLTQTAGETRSRTESQASNRTNSKTNNSEILKGAELNGQMLRGDNPTKNGSNKISNMNLVVLHRQNYSSNNTVSAYPENGQGADVFYNLNQSNVARKFFKKQRQNMKRICLEIPNKRDCDTDSHASLPLAYKETYIGMANIINSGSKVNNTNLHVEKGQLSENGFKEMRLSTNPNVLLEEDECNTNYNKNYRTDGIKQWKSDNVDEAKSHNSNSTTMNIYTNVPETMVPQHQVVTSNSPCRDHISNHRTSISEECLQSRANTEPQMRTVSQQCSLEYSSASEIDNHLNHTCSDQTLNTHSELTSLQDTRSALCSTNEITTDTESFSHYIDYLQPSRNTELLRDSNEKIINDGNTLDKSLQDISEECMSNSNDDLNHSTGTTNHIDDTEMSELGKLMHMKQSDENNIGCSKEKLEEQKKHYYLGNNLYNFETASMNVSEQGFENESDIYYPNYQVSEVSIRSHGLYAPSPASICPNEMSISFSNEDVSHSDNQYVNFNPAWRKNAIKNGECVPKFVSSPVLTCHEENRDSSSPVSFVSELEELYTQITNNRTPRVSENANLDNTMNSDVTLKLCENDSCVSESFSDIGHYDGKAETTV